jgi:hypothetical protein
MALLYPVVFVPAAEEFDRLLGSSVAGDSRGSIPASVRFPRTTDQKGMPCPH